MKTRVGRRGTSTIYASLIFLLLMFSILSLLFMNYYNYNSSLQGMTNIEQARLLEHFMISDLILDDLNQTITHVVVNNTGTIDVRIRAIYKMNVTATELVCDPSTYMDSVISPKESLRIPLLSTIPIEPAAEIIIVSERGVKTQQYQGVIIFGPPPFINYDTNKYYIGPMMLLFDAFWYRRTFANGTFDPDDYWHDGWFINKGFGYCVWNLSVTNVDYRDITLNRYSSFTLVPSDSPSNELTWYMESASETLDYTLVVNQTQSLLFQWATPLAPESSSTAQKITLPEATSMGFLTLFGFFHEPDGTKSPYAQTIPFEAVVTVQAGG